MTERKRRRSRLSVALATIVLSVALTGCGSGTGEEPVTMTLEEAKSQVWQVEDELVALIPSEAVTQRWPRQETSAVLFECSDQPGRYYWPGGTEIGIDPATDVDAVLTGIHDAWLGRPGWQVRWLNHGTDGKYHLDLLREDGLHFGITNLAGNTRLHFGGFSPCFELADYDPHRTY